MIKLNFTSFTIPSVFSLAQLGAILFYLYENIVNVGNGGTALPMLAAFFGISGVVFLYLCVTKSLILRQQFLVFLIFLFWIQVKVLIDLNDLEKLKSITFGTTGGILMFYLIGAFSAIAYVRLLENRGNAAGLDLIVLFSLALVIFMILSFGLRIRSDIFYISGVDGDYQRPGNLLSIFFILTSAVFIGSTSKKVLKASKWEIMLWFLVYVVIAAAAIISSQMFGSNSASGVISGIFILTFPTAFLINNQTFNQTHFNNKSSSSILAQVVKRLLVFATISFVFLLITLGFIAAITGTDIMSIRLFGFGFRTNNSIVSRVEILSTTGFEQICNAPLFGNLKIGRVTAAGYDLHNFFPYIQANFGLIGTILSVSLFFMIFQQLYKKLKILLRESCLVNNALITFYFAQILLFLLLFANATVTVSWAVLWFAVGFISQPFGFRERR